MNYILTTVLLVLKTSGCLSQLCGVHRNTEFTNDGTDCGRQCDNLVNDIKCEQAKLIAGCFCKPGYHRNSAWDCVSETDCAKQKTGYEPKCGKNAIFAKCGNLCKNSCESLNVKDCPKNSCDSGCFCDIGFRRDETGKCVAKDKCKKPADSKKCNKNDNFLKCGNLCKNSCEGLIKFNCAKDRCDDGCFCAAGLWRNKNDDCVSPEKCKKDFNFKTINCGKHSQYLKCGNLCKNHCKSRKSEKDCLETSCLEGCFCEKGYRRNDQGICVKENECNHKPGPEPVKCGKDQIVVQCGNLCKNTCEGLIKRHCPETSCDNGCYCDRGLWRNKEGVCVSKKECKNDFSRNIENKKTKKCGKNAVYGKCGNLCKNGCRSLKRKGHCTGKRCDDGCFCVAGYWRNYNGICVKKKECYTIMLKDKLKITIRNLTVITTETYDAEEQSESTEENEASLTTTEEYDNETESNGLTEHDSIETTELSDSTEETSESTTQQTSTTQAYTEESTTEESTTEESTTEESTTEESTTEESTTEESTTEESTTEESTTEEQTKETTEFSEQTSLATTTEEDASEKTSTDDSVEESTEPPLKCKMNEHYSKCGSTCGESCQLQNSSSEKSCPPECKPGCFCDEGLLRNGNDICVPTDQCICKLQEQKCDTNEQFYWCHNECGRTCSHLNNQTNKECNSKCSRGCLCKEGFVRNDAGICVEPEKCVKYEEKCNTNEIYAKCGSDCGKGCEDLNKNGTESDCEPCTAGCFCAQGYFRNQNQECVQKDDCQLRKNGLSKAKKECRAEEEYTECGNFCTENCDISNQDANNCPYNCVKGCHCRKGYKRNGAGICVIESKCKEKPKCKSNEEYSECGTDCDHRCIDLSKSNNQCPLSCEKGCFCTSGYFRERNNTCVPKDECVIDPIECPDKEEYKKCGTHCGESCEDLRNPVECPKECEEGCFCQKGLFRDIEGTCVTKAKCDLEPSEKPIPNCPSNEVYKECGNKCDESCEDRIDCKTDCQSGCFCADGYLRHKTGKCVAEDQCKALQQCIECESTEYYSDCGNDCGKFCSDLGNEQKCRLSCRKACFCKHGFYRNELGKCVTKDKCHNKLKKPRFEMIEEFTEITVFNISGNSELIDFPVKPDIIETDNPDMKQIKGNPKIIKVKGKPKIFTVDGEAVIIQVPEKPEIVKTGKKTRVMRITGNPEIIKATPKPNIYKGRNGTRIVESGQEIRIIKGKPKASTQDLTSTDSKEEVTKESSHGPTETSNEESTEGSAEWS